MVQAIQKIFNNIKYFIDCNLSSFACIIEFILPYCAFFIGQYEYQIAGQMTCGREVIYILILYMLILFLKSIANKRGKGDKLPIPSKRFTKRDEINSVSVNNSDLSEMILYLADLEDYIDKYYIK